MKHSRLTFRSCSRLARNLFGSWPRSSAASSVILLLGLVPAELRAEDETESESRLRSQSSPPESAPPEVPGSAHATEAMPATSPVATADTSVTAQSRDARAESDAGAMGTRGAEARRGRTPAERSLTLSPDRSRALWPLTWEKSPGQGVAFGLEEGLWGGAWGQGLRVTVPFARNFAATLRGIYLMEMGDGPVTVDAGGRLDFVGRSDVLFNVMRLYGGGGVQVIAPITDSADEEVRVGGGGHFGFEFFCSPHYSFFLEVGGQGGSVSPGATVMAGMMFYPWTR